MASRKAVQTNLCIGVNRKLLSYGAASFFYQTSAGFTVTFSHAHINVYGTYHFKVLTPA